uniref:PPUP7148 n=1 Tax=Poeciliopsis prolifica TaxID=188132 RepID=A0A0S7F0H3_9TELE
MLCRTIVILRNNSLSIDKGIRTFENRLFPSSPCLFHFRPYCQSCLPVFFAKVLREPDVELSADGVLFSGSPEFIPEDSTCKLDNNLPWAVGVGRAEAVYHVENKVHLLFPVRHDLLNNIRNFLSCVFLLFLF